MNYNRPFIYLLWKDQNNPNNLSNFDRLKGVDIPETIVITKNREYFSQIPFKIDWFFHSVKTNGILRRHSSNVNMVTLQNFLIKKAQKSDQLLDYNDFKAFQSSLVATLRTYEFDPIVSQGSDLNSGTIKQLTKQQLLDSQQIVEITNSIMQLRKKDVKDEIMIFQSYSEPYLDCIYEVSAEIVNHGGYSYQSMVQRFSDHFLIKDPKTQQRFQQYLNEEVIGASSEKVDWHLEKTLTPDFQSYLKTQSTKVIKYINSQYLQLNSLQLYWIIKIKNGFPANIQLVDIKNVIFKADEHRPRTLGHQELMQNLFLGKKIQAKKEMGSKQKSISVGVYGKNETRLNSFLSNYSPAIVEQEDLYLTQSRNKKRNQSSNSTSVIKKKLNFEDKERPQTQIHNIMENVSEQFHQNIQSEKQLNEDLKQEIKENAMEKYKLSIPPDQFNSEDFLEKTIKLKEEQEIGLLVAKNQSEQKVEMARENLIKEQEELKSIQQQIEMEKNLIQYLRSQERNYEKENAQYRKLMKDEKDFHIQNLMRVNRDRMPPVDKMVILDADHNEIEFQMEFSNQEAKIQELLSMRDGENGERVSAISNSQAYLKAMAGYNGQHNQLKLYQKSIKDQMKDLKNFERRCKKILQVENAYREEILEYLYTIAYPMVRYPPGGKSFQVPAIIREKARLLDKKNEKIEKAVMKIYTIPFKKLADVDPKKIDMIIKMKDSFK